MPRWLLRAAPSPLTCMVSATRFWKAEGTVIWGQRHEKAVACSKERAKAGYFLLRNLVSAVRREQLVEKGGRYG